MTEEQWQDIYQLSKIWVFIDSRVGITVIKVEYVLFFMPLCHEYEVWEKRLTHFRRSL